MSNWYRAGTIAVTSGSTAVVGTTTAWLNQVKQGDLIVFANGTFGEISVDPVDNTALTLQTPYVGTTGSGQSYAIARFSDGWRPTAELALRVASFLSSAVQIYSGNGVPSAGLGGDGSVYFRQDVPQYYSKSGGAWGSPISLLGPQGPAGAGFSIASTTSNAIGTGSKAFTIASGGLSYLGARMRAAVTASPTNFVEGIVTAATATSVTITSDAIGGTGTHAAWSLVVAGDKGSQGLPGSPSTGASSSTVTVGVGNLTFAVTAGLDLIVGQRVRFAETAAPTVRWVEGIITAYSGGSMTINVANDGISTAGSGAVSAWTFGIIGSRGLTGPTGAASTVPGPAGASYNATSVSSIAISTGNKTFAIGTNTAYLPGARVRVANTAAPSTHWMEGECITYSAGNITIAVDAVGTGTGTLASWNFAIAGELGVPGTNGVSITSTGDYNAITVYSKGDLARNGGASWVYINATAGAGVDPPDLPTESNTHWHLVSRDGADGSGAVNSVNGEIGDVILDAGLIPAPEAALGYTPVSGNVQGHLDGLGNALLSAGAAFAPTGRLTLSTGVSVMTSAVTGAATVYYTPHAGAFIPIHDGTKFVARPFTELSNVLANSATGKAGPAAALAAKNYDLFVWDDAGALTLSRGPPWTSDTARGTGPGTTNIARLDGYWVNTQAITNGPAANRGTYVGTIRTNAGAATVDFSFGGSAAGGTAASLGVWNAYNRVDTPALVQNSTATWTYDSATPRQVAGSNAMRVNFVTGLAEDRLAASWQCVGGSSGSGAAVNLLMLDSTTVASGIGGYCSRESFSAGQATLESRLIGFHYIQAGEQCNTGAAGTITWYGSASGSLFINGLSFALPM